MDEDGPPCLGDGPGAAAIRFVLECTEEAAALPLERAADPLRRELTEALVSPDPGEGAYRGLVARLRLRRLEAESRQLDREVTTTERGGDAAAVTGLQRRKMELDREIRRWRIEAAGRKGG
jgi:hypothetical protein